MIIETNLTSKQLQAFRVLQDKETTEVFYGGGAGGGKSYLGCFWLVYCALNYSGSRWLMGRARLTTLKKSTLLTFFEVLKLFQQKKDKDWKYNSIENTISFKNSSTIYLKDLFLYPADPEFDNLGSTEYTGIFLDEVSEITEKAKNIAMSRIRYKLDEFNLIPKMLMASNPTKNFAYREFWKPYIENNMPTYKKFIPALVGDNPFISNFYAENLKKLDKNSMERLLLGNWNYDDDPSKLFEYDKLINVFNLPEKHIKTMSYISADIARFGSDKSVVIVWRGLRIIKVYVGEKQSTEITKNAIVNFSNLHQVPIRNIVIDDDGVGGGVVDQLRGVRGFVNNGKPYEPLKNLMLTRHNFANLKTQCYVKLSELINTDQVSSEPLDINIKNMIIEDLQQVKIKDIDKDNKLTIIPKEEIKENLGRSPDFGDALMMRMLFEVLPTQGILSPVGTTHK